MVNIVGGYTKLKTWVRARYVKNTGDIITGNLDFSGNQIINVTLELLEDAPAETEGRIYYNTNTKKIYIYVV